MEQVTEGVGGTTRGFSEDEITKPWNVTDETPNTTLPSSTSGQVDSVLRFLEPSGEAVGSASDVSSTTSSEVTLLTDLSASDNKETILLTSSEEKDSPLWLNEWEKPEGEIDVDSVTGSPVAVTSKKSVIYTQSPETVINPTTESTTNYQSDSSTDSYFLVSAEATCAAGVEIALLPCQKDKLLKGKV